MMETNTVSFAICAFCDDISEVKRTAVTNKKKMANNKSALAGTSTPSALLIPTKIGSTQTTTAPAPSPKNQSSACSSLTLRARTR